MSFSLESKQELVLQQVKSKCCRRAMLAGLLFSATAENGIVRTSFDSGETATTLAIYIREFYNTECVMSMRVLCGRKRYFLECSAKGVYKLVKSYNDEGKKLIDIIERRCGFCEQGFLRGIFLAIGSVNDPHTSFHAELSLTDPIRADKLDILLAELGIPSRKIIRGKRIGLYYKKSSDIEDFFASMGASSIAFKIINSKIEKEIRNNENRATNLVATNISRSVDAAGKQIEGILKLKKNGRFEYLPDDLRHTAELRLANSEMSLAELAEIHVPPISKSGLNHRMSRLAAEAAKLK